VGEGRAKRVVVLAMVLAMWGGVLAGGVARAATVSPYATNNYSGFWYSILPPGANGLVNPQQLGAYELNNATKPPHNDDQSAMYSNLVYGAPTLTDAQIPQYFTDATFGVKAGNVDAPRTVSFSNPPVTIIRDTRFGIPHVYGNTRVGVMFGAGYAAAQDRLFFMDVLRHTGRSELSSFAGGSNIGMDESTFALDPYTDQELANQVTALPREYGAEGQQVKDDIDNYVAGINQYINQAKVNPLLMPGEYAALGHPAGPDAWTPGDVVSVADVIGGILGNGGGDQLSWAKILGAMQQRFGSSAGLHAYLDFRDPEDPEAPLTARTGSFPYQTPPAHPAPDAVALPDAGSLANEPIRTAGAGARSPARAVTSNGAARGILGASSIKQAFPQGLSNALLVSAAHTVSGHPIAVIGPQVGYFAPQVLMQEDLHGPGMDAAGAAVTGASMYVELGHGQDYAWSATSADQGVTDIFTVPLCNTDGSPATKSSDAYVLNGRCTPMVTVTRANSWVPNAADQTAPGSETLAAQRTANGIVVARATVHGQPVAFTRQRATFMHEIDSAVGFRDFNDPGAVHDVQSFQHAAYKIGYTFNWLYTDDRDIGYFNSGANPVRNANTDGLLPTPSKYEWQGFDPATNTADYTPFAQHPQVVNQDYITSWNNKEAQGYRAIDGVYGSLYRSQLLDDRIQAGLAGGRKMTLAQLISAMEDAGTVDLRADKVLPWILRVIGTQPVSDPRQAGAIAELQAWVNDRSHRLDPNRSGSYQHSDAIRILDGWWPLLVNGEFQPAMGQDAYNLLAGQVTIDNNPNNGGGHLGSAYDNGWYSYVQKDLRDLLAQVPAGGCRPVSRIVGRRGHQHHRGHNRHRGHQRHQIGRGLRARRPHRPRPGGRVGVCPTASRSTSKRVARRRHAAHAKARPGRQAARRRAEIHKRPHRSRAAPRPTSAAAAPAPAVLGPYSRVYCGNGSLTACRAMLLSTLSQAIGMTPQQLYADATCAAAGRQYDQECYDSIAFRAVGVVSQPLLPWINRPTFQQAVEITGHRPR